MSAVLHIIDSLGQRRVERADFPLALGGPGCALVVDRTASAPLAWLGLHDDALFVQPAAAGSLRHNGLPVQGSTWLHVGDVISVGTVLIRLTNPDGTRRLEVDDGGTGNVTAPPVIERGALLSGTTAAGLEPVVSMKYQRAQSAKPRARRSRLGAVVGAGAGLLIVLLLWFLATGVAVQLNVTPAHAQLNVSGSWLTPRFGTQLFVRPGRYTLRARASGYQPQDYAFAVGGEAGQAVALQLRKLPGKVRVELVAPGTLQIDAAGALKVPAVIEVAAGKHAVLIEAPGYLPYRGEIAVQGEGKTQTLAPSLVANSAPVAISSEPSAAQVLIDTRPAGVTPLHATLPAATHHVELRLAGFKPWTMDLLVKAGEPQTIGPVRLGLPDASLMLRSNPAGARVMAGGVYRGETPLRLILRPDVATALSLALPGHEDATRSVKLRPAATEEMNVELTPILGKVTVRVTPGDAEIWVDGASRGRGSQTLTLTTAAHQVEVRKPGFLSASSTVTPRLGFDQALDVTILTEAQQRVARTPAVVRAHGSIEMRLMPLGHFTMGSTRREPGRRANEGQRPVELRRLFYLGTREISNAQFREFRAEHKSGIFGGVSLNADSQPVAQVSWQDAVAYCNWLSQQDGLPPAYRQQGGELVAVSPMTTGYRLPSEAEWEWAARSGAANHRYPWGDGLPVAPNSGNYADVSARAPLTDVIGGYDDGFPVSAAVGSFAASPLGLYDLGGNVSEWTTDFYAVSYSPDVVAVDPMNLAAGNQHAVRGASWRSADSSELRVAARAAGAAPRDDLGFRIARYAE
jgi:formylglycine-generating enzyme required for sulfatase activity